MPANKALSAFLLLFAVVFPACGKEEKEAEAADAELAREIAAAVEMEKRNSELASLVAERQTPHSKITATLAKLEKQGNKTRRRLKPELLLEKSMK